MPIPVACQCGASFNAKDELAGKAVRCPKCKQPLKIPAPQPAPAAASALDDLFDEVGISQKEGPMCPNCGEGLKPNAILCVACGFNTQTGETAQGVSVAGKLAGHEGSAEDVLERAAKQIEVDKEEDRKNKSSGAPAYVYLFGLILIAAFGGMMFTMPKGIAFQITGWCLIGFAYCLTFYYQIRHLIIAFQESAAAGFFHFIPVFSIFWAFYYLVTRWDKVGVWFMKSITTALPLAILGGLLVGLGILLMSFAEDDKAYLEPRDRGIAARVEPLLTAESRLTFGTAPADTQPS